MIVCTKCGFQNLATDSFCGSCGSFLEWTGSKVEEPTVEPIVTEAPAAPVEPEHQTFVGRVREAVGLGGGSAVTSGSAGEPIEGTASAPTTSAHETGGAAAGPTGSPTAASAPSETVVVSSARVFRMAEPEPA